jgi:hypothetical protein
MAFYHDPQRNVEISLEGAPAPSWVAISETIAESLGQARKLGAIVYINESGLPVPFFVPEQPTLAWNEVAHLLPFEVINGEGRQQWAVTKITIDEQARLLGELRWGKQNTGLVYFDSEAEEWVSTTDPEVAGSVYIPTDALTMTTLMGIKSDYDRGINVSRDWKVSTLNFVTFTNEQLAAAYVKGQEYWQTAFSIERKYGDLIAAGQDVNIYEWSL